MSCRKIKYLSKDKALFIIEKMMEDVCCLKKPKRVYKCDECGHWHITSMSHKKHKTAIWTKDLTNKLDAQEQERKYWEVKLQKKHKK